MKIRQMALGDIVPYARNPRKNDTAVDKVMASIREFGFRQPIVIDADSVVIAGHTRLEAARELGLAKVPVHVAEGLTAAQVKAYRLADNRTAEEASWDSELLALELNDLKLEEFDLSLTGFDVGELDAAMLDGMFEPGSEEEQGQLDEKTKLNCPECGHEFTP